VSKSVNRLLLRASHSSSGSDQYIYSLLAMGSTDGEQCTSGVSSKPPPRVFTAIRNVINSPNFRITSRLPIGWAPDLSSALGSVETDAICRSSLSSKTEREVDRERERERVYRASKEAREGEDGNEDSSGGPPRRIRFPKTCVALRRHRQIP